MLRYQPSLPLYLPDIEPDTLTRFSSWKGLSPKSLYDSANIFNRQPKLAQRLSCHEPYGRTEKAEA
jgi:hypothetical protein